MSQSNLHFSVKFFRPPQRTVSCHNGLLNTRTKHTIAQDRLIVAEQQKLDIEQRKSSSNIQLLTFEQKQIEKKLLSLQNINQSIQNKCYRSISEANLQNIHQLNELHKNLNSSNQNLLSLPNFDNYHRRFSAYSDGDISSNHDLEDKKKIIQLPIVAIIPPEEADLYLI